MQKQTAKAKFTKKELAELAQLKATIREFKQSSKNSRQQQKPRSRGSNQRSKTLSNGVAVNYSKDLRSNGPRVQGSRESCRIRHKEFIGNIVSSDEYQVTSYPVNPGMKETFPWLSTQAPAWERYRFHSLKFIFHTRSATSTFGSVLLSPDYDSSAGTPESEVVQSAYMGTCEGAPWKEHSCVLSPKQMESNVGDHFLRSGAVPGDVKLYDVAQFLIATLDAVGSPVVWGKLWVEYDVSFIIPQLPPLGPPATALSGGRISWTTGGTGPVAPFGSTPTVGIRSVGLAIDARAVVLSEEFSSFCDVVIDLFFSKSDLAALSNFTTAPTITATSTDGESSVITSDLLGMTTGTNRYIILRAFIRRNTGLPTVVTFDFTPLGGAFPSGMGGDGSVSVCPPFTLSLSKPPVLEISPEEIELLRNFRLKQKFLNSTD